MHMLEMIWPHIHLISSSKCKEGESEMPSSATEDTGGLSFSAGASDYGGSGWGGGSVGSGDGDGDGGSDSQYSDEETVV